MVLSQKREDEGRGTCRKVIKRAESQRTENGCKNWGDEKSRRQDAGEERLDLSEQKEKTH